MRILILEDAEPRIEQFRRKLSKHELSITKDIQECIWLLRTEKWDYLFLDHDMGIIFETSGRGTGYEVAKFIAEHPSLAPKNIIIHTMNSVGGENMMRVLQDAGLHPSYIPQVWEHLVICS